MKLKFLLSAIVLTLTTPFVLAADLSELMSPDDVMLRKPSRKQAQAPGLTPSETQAAKDDVDRRFAEAKAQAESEAAARARLDAEAARRIREAAEKKAAAKAEAERKAAAEKAAAEAAAKAEAERKAAAEKAAAKAEAERKAAAETAAKAEAERKAAEAKKADDEIKRLREQVAAEKAAREKAEKKVAYLQNPDPDEKPQPKKLVAPATDDRDVTETVAGAATADAPKKKYKAKKGDQKKAGTKREAVITSDRTDYDRKEGIILFDRNVCVDDEQYQMHADRLFVFLDGTNDLKRLVAIGHVAITNEEKSASCTRAVYTKATSKIVMYGDEANMARLHDASKKGGTVKGRRIIFWLNSEEVEVEGSQIEMPTGSLKAGSPKDFFDKAK